MALTAEQRRSAAKQWVRKAYKEAKASATMDRDDIFAAVDAVNMWADDNQASFVAALPEPFKTTSNAQQKSLMLAYVALVRTGVI